MDKFTKTYLKIIAEENGFKNLSDTVKYNMTLLYTVIIDDLITSNYNDEELEEGKYFNDIKKEADEFFTKFGGKRITNEDLSLSYYINSLKYQPKYNDVYAWPYTFTEISKNQIFELMNLETPYNDGESILETIRQYVYILDLKNKAENLEINAEEDPDVMIEYLNQIQGKSMIQKFKKA